MNGSITTATFFGVWIQFVYEFELSLLLWMVLYIKIVNELQSRRIMGELITRFFSWVGSSNSVYTICTHENRLYYLLKNNNLTIDQRTENPRVGGSIPSRPTFLTRLKLGTYRHFVSIFFYFSSAEFHWKSPNGAAVSGWFTVILSTQSVHNLYTPLFGFTDFMLTHEHD